MRLCLGNSDFFFEEQLVVTKRLILKEEIRITRRSRRELVREPVRLRSDIGSH